MVVGLIVGVVTLVMSLDIRTRMGRVGRFVGAFLVAFCLGSMFYGLSIADWFSGN